MIATESSNFLNDGRQTPRQRESCDHSQTHPPSSAAVNRGARKFSASKSNSPIGTGSKVGARWLTVPGDMESEQPGQVGALTPEGATRPEWECAQRAPAPRSAQRSSPPVRDPPGSAAPGPEGRGEKDEVLVVAVTIDVSSLTEGRKSSARPSVAWLTPFALHIARSSAFHSAGNSKRLCGLWRRAPVRPTPQDGTPTDHRRSSLQLADLAACRP